MVLDKVLRANSPEAALLFENDHTAQRRKDMIVTTTVQHRQVTHLKLGYCSSRESLPFGLGSAASWGPFCRIPFVSPVPAIFGSPTFGTPLWP